MTIKELKLAIKDLPDDMDVFMAERVSEFTYGLVNSAFVYNVHFKEDPNPDSPVLAVNKALILSED